MTLSLQLELTRKAIHLIAIIFPIAYALGVSRVSVAGALMLAALTALLIELGRRRQPAMREWFTRTTSILLRAHEHDGLSGATWLVLSLLGSVLLLPRDIAVAAMWAVAAGDASAAVVGRAFGRHPIGATAKTLEGSAACLLVTFAGALIIAHLSVGESIVSAMAATLAERPTRPLDDNVRIVIAVAVAILLWRIAFS